MNHQKRYLSHLLRMWQEGAESAPVDTRGEPPLWRASLEGPNSYQRQAFASLADLFAFLEEQTGTRSLGVKGREGRKDLL